MAHWLRHLWGGDDNLEEDEYLGDVMSERESALLKSRGVLQRRTPEEQERALLRRRGVLQRPAPEPNLATIPGAALKAIAAEVMERLRLAQDEPTQPADLAKRARLQAYQRYVK